MIIYFLVPYQYSLKDITRVFINMNLMKKFDLPKELETTPQEIIRNEPKTTLDHFKDRNYQQGAEKRNRAYTHNDINYSNNSKL